MNTKEGLIEKTKTELEDARKKLGKEEEEKKKLRHDLEETKLEF